MALLLCYALAMRSPVLTYGLVYRAISTDSGYGAAIVLRSCYAKSGTDLGYGATRSSMGSTSQARDELRGGARDEEEEEGRGRRRDEEEGGKEG
eukprot:2127820-Rhodomonas_salina.2